MIVRYDPRDLSRVHLLAPDGRYYDLSYRDLRRPPISLWEHRLALKRLRDEGRAEVDEDAIFRAIERCAALPRARCAETKTARRQRERRLRRDGVVTESACRAAIAAESARRSSTAARRSSGCSRTWRNGHERTLLSASAAADSRARRRAWRDRAYGASARIGGSATHGRKPPWRRWRIC